MKVRVCDTRRRISRKRGVSSTGRHSRRHRDRLRGSQYDRTRLLARGLVTKHAIKQVDRLLSNRGVDIDAALLHWVRYVVGFRTSLNVAMDWTEFDADGQATIMLSLLTRHGRATPLMWLTVDKSTLLLSEAALLHIDGNVLDRPVRHIDGCLGAAVELERQQADKDTRPEHCLVVIALIDPGNGEIDTA